MTAPARTLHAPGRACIDLTPLIAGTIRELAPGDLLEVHTDDPAARVGVPAWCRRTRHRLVHTINVPSSEETPTNGTTFHIIKKESTA